MKVFFFLVSIDMPSSIIVPIEALEKAIEGGNLISYDILGKRVVKFSDLHALMQPSA